MGFYKGGLHHGTHVDAPWHFIPGGKKLDAMPLEHWVGPCLILDMRHLERCIDAHSLEEASIPRETRRVLFKTRNGDTDYWHEPWNPNFIYLDKTAARYCTDRGLLTIGLDYLTIDPPAEDEFPSHMELLGNETLILENICLRDVQPGEYELFAAPVRVIGVDGGWCRALLRTKE